MYHSVGGLETRDDLHKPIVLPLNMFCGVIFQKLHKLPKKEKAHNEHSHYGLSLSTV
jgi:hypothetical protein